MHIYLARHGQNEDNLNGILNGHRDEPLTEVGVRQAREAASNIKQADIHFDVVYSSPLIRAFRTAEIISEITDSPNPIKHPKLIERDFGIMTGERISDIEELCGKNIIKTDTITYFVSCDGAETFPELVDRGKDLVRELNIKHEGENILLVSHGDIGKMIYAGYYDLPWKEVLYSFHFGNSELLFLSKNSPPENTHLFKIHQHNH